ncbi:MAG TPA: nucleoside-diphosphate sugar epimerase/dehydratase [Burkholderiaceae bacterium]|jgi:FlaA1/EpsC-like NDP-sugar epimerase|nr:nucleoside-diphosphate sugar epimerase/dehydratase [Burkholderiaceae bacterium]
MNIWHRLDDFLSRVRVRRTPLVVLADAIVIALAWQFTYLFRLGFERWLSARPHYDSFVLAGIVVLYLCVFLLLGVPRGMWRFSGFGEIKRLTVACALAGALAAVLVLMAQLREVPRAVLALHPVIALMGLASVRIGYRMLYEHMRAQIAGKAPDARRALVLGAGDAARLLLAGVQHQGWVVVGLLDDDLAKQRTRLAGVPVLGTLEQLPELAAEHAVTHVIVAMPSARAAQRQRVIELAGQTRLPVLTVPSAQELLEGVAVSRVRDVQPEDLLGREPVVLDEAGIAECLSGKTVMVTGAGGSIGSELCRQVARYGPARLVLYELSEFNLYRIEQELSERHPHLPLVRLIGDVKNLEHLRRVHDKWHPQIVFHAAAYKHVPLMEEDNAWAALQNNTLGTYRAALAAAEAGCERFVLISTDKAVNPTNVMGASKRAAEMVISHLAAQGHRTRFMAVRFGNVLGSSGSVIPKFKEQIARGGPVTVTHPEITRYFMTIPEAARLVVQAAAIGETGQVYVLDMGEPVKIVELAKALIRLSGHGLDEIAIAFTGLRPGEKLYEELLADADTTLPTPIARLRIARLDRQHSLEDFSDWLARIESGVMPVGRVRDALIKVVPDFSHK